MTMPDRRQMLAGSAALAGLAAAGRAGAAQASFPQGFLWGAAVAGYQVEGGNTNADIWLVEHLPHTPFAEKSGDACDQYHLFEQDIALLASFGLNAFRFSLEWSRIEPEPGEFSNAELNHYRRVAAVCREHGVTPVLTYNHFAVPRWFAARGGWEVADSSDLFARYCDKATGAIGDLAGLASTFNEPNIGRLLKYMLPPQVFAMFPGLMHEAAAAAGSKHFSTIQFADQAAILPNLISAHEKAYAAIKAGPGDFPVGLSLAIFDDQAEGKNSMRDAVRAEAYGAWLDAVKRTGDFIGAQTYTRQRWGKDGPLPVPAGVEQNQMHEEFYPDAIGHTVRYAHAATGKPVYVTENGVATEDDSRRVEYIRRALAGVKSAIDDGVPVRGYVQWSLLDNFEWVSGYGPKFGLVAVDRATQKRTPKPSAAFYGAIAKRNSL